MDHFTLMLAKNWHVWVVSVTLIVAAVIDGYQLRVPNWLTYPMIISGWIYSFALLGWGGLGWSMLGMTVGLLLLLPLYAIGGMGAGDVKLLAGVGAWMYSIHVFYAFCLSAIVGAVLAVAMVVMQKAWTKHKAQFWMILNEIATVKSPTKLAETAAERKSSMMLLPYGIPIAIGSIIYFIWADLLI